MKLQLLILLFIFPLFSFCQNHNIQGEIVDSAANINLVKSAILVLDGKDSTLVTFSRTNKDGLFKIGSLNSGSYILMVSYPHYADYLERFVIDTTTTIVSFKRINLQLSSQLLKEIIIRGAVPQVKMRGDTTEYNASTFVIKPNSKVEDLLRQLPGIQVDRSGKISARGQVVNKVLIDGEEFFGDDPTLVTKNIRGDMVDKIQLYDKKSDQATFTDIDDGNKTKTINVILKAEKKTGYFGKVDLGYGSEDFYQSQLLFNRFRENWKFSAYSTTSNDGKTGLSWRESQKYSTSDNVQVSGDGGSYTISNNGDDLDTWNGTYTGKGIPITFNSGLHFDSKWNTNGKESININYKVGTLTIDGSSNTLSQSILPGDNAIKTTLNQKFNNYLLRNKLDFTYLIKLDSTSSLKISADGTRKKSKTENSYEGSSSTKLDTLLNSNVRDVNNIINTTLGNAGLFYTKKFRKKGRSFSLNTNASLSKSDGSGNIFSFTEYFNSTLGVVDSAKIIDQNKVNRFNNSSFNNNVTYTEPLFRQISAIFSYALGINRYESERQSLNSNDDGLYTLVDTNFTNSYRVHQTYHQAGIILNWKVGKNVINFGNKVSSIILNQVNVTKRSAFNRFYIINSPLLNYKYKISPTSNFSFDYTGNAELPTIDQMQPISSNNDPLHIIVGNPDLLPAFRSEVKVSYHKFKVSKERFLFIGGNYSNVSRSIVHNTVTDSIGQSITYFQNTTSSPTHVSLNLDFGQKIGSNGLRLGFGINISGDKAYSISNGELNEIKSSVYGGNIKLQRSVAEKYDFNLSLGPSVVAGKSSLQPGIRNNSAGGQANGGFTYYVQKLFAISTDINYKYNSRTDLFINDFSRLLWNAQITKSLTRKENLEISLTCNDILNQNSGFERSSNGTILNQEQFTAIRRYFMLTVVWDFNRMSGTKQQ
jgi:hypothetical protein